MTRRFRFHFSLSCIGEGNGNWLQCSCLENPRDRGALWAAVYGVAQVGHDWSDLAAAADNFGIVKTVILEKTKPFLNDCLSLSLGCFWDIPILAQEGNPVSPLEPSLFYPLYVPGLQRQVSRWMYPPVLQLLRVNVVMWSPLLIFLLMCLKDRVTLFL